MDFFGAQTGFGMPSVNVGEQGSPEYQRAIYEQAQQRLQPSYQMALRNLNQNFASRGLGDSGLAGQAQMGLRQGYLNQLGGVAQNAALQGAGLAEQNRRRGEQRQWQLQDRAAQFDFLREQAKRQEEIAGANRWASLLGGALGAAGGIGGQLLGRYLFPMGGGVSMPQQSMDGGMMGYQPSYDMGGSIPGYME